VRCDMGPGLSGDEGRAFAGFTASIAVLVAQGAWSAALQATFAPFSLTGLVFSPPMAFQPMPLCRRPLPLDHPEWIFELKYDGFRSLAVIQNGRTELISRNGHPFSFDLRGGLHAGKTVLDGEIVCVDEQGKPQFRNPLFHRGEPCFFAFDLLMSDGKDLRSRQLIDRKRELRRVLAGLTPSRMRRRSRRARRYHFV
jgi:ATP-dependent DNA ligase